MSGIQFNRTDGSSTFYPVGPGGQIQGQPYAPGHGPGDGAALSTDRPAQQKAQADALARAGRASTIMGDTTPPGGDTYAGKTLG